MQTAQELNAAGMQALKAGDFASAARHFERACAVDPTAVPLWRNLAHARRSDGDHEGERKALESALAIDRTDFGAWLRKAQLHQRLGEDGDGFHAWSGVLQLAAGLSQPGPGLLAELADGQAYVDGLRGRLDGAIGAGLAPVLGSLDSRDRRRVSAFVDHALGRRQIYRNECAGLLYPFLPADEYFDDGHFPWFAGLAQRHAAVRDEALALLKDPGEALRPYVRLDKGTPDNKWSKLDGDLSWGACFLWEYGEPNRAVLDRCPETAAALAAAPGARMPGRAPSAFFSILRAGAYIPAHTGVSNTRAIVHFPLVVPPGCRFRVGGETREWVEGRPFAFDDTIEHEAWNDGTQDRIVLIFDVWNPHLSEAEQGAIVAYYNAADGAGLAPARE